jgi:hypothetical protein
MEPIRKTPKGWVPEQYTQEEWDNINRISNEQVAEALAWEKPLDADDRLLKYVADRKKENALRKQEGGNHYKDMAIQPVEFITANNLGFLEGNVVKYICRHQAKNGAEDIKKAIHYCEMLLATKYK